MGIKRYPISIKRAYEQRAAVDGCRVLVDRLWPRGLTREKAKIDLWLKDIAPSSELRVWFGHAPARFAEFGRRYRAELKRSPEAVAQVVAIARETAVTLIYAAKDPTCNHALVLQAFLSGKPAAARKPRSATIPKPLKR
jgi:uncharacterized protein YeaO (DUF488 family)